MQFKFKISVGSNGPCKKWIVDSSDRKLSDIENYITAALQDSACKMTVSCVANSQFICKNDPNIVIYE